MTGYPAALALTLAVEVPVYALALRRSLGTAPAVGVGLGCLVNLITHPVVWWVLSRGWGSYEALLPLTEVAAWLVEAALIMIALRNRAVAILVTALAANAGSFLVGLLLT